MIPCFKAVVNIEDKHPLNLDKFQLCVELLLNCPYRLRAKKGPAPPPPQGILQTYPILKKISSRIF